jgi:hypothetical protein
MYVVREVNASRFLRFSGSEGFLLVFRCTDGKHKYRVQFFSSSQALVYINVLHIFNASPETSKSRS